MKLFLLLLAITLNAQYNYSNQKIDMHGGNHNALGAQNAARSYQNRMMNISKYLDKNSSKTLNKKNYFKFHLQRD